MYDTNISVTVREEQARDSREERRQRGGDGQRPSPINSQAKGLVIHQRENSIFSDAWVPLAIILLVAGLFASRNAGLMALGLTLLIVAGISHLWKDMALLGVTYERNFDRTRAFPGEPIEMTVSVANSKMLPLTWLRFRDELPVSPEEDLISQAANEVTGKYILQYTFSLTGWEQVERNVVLHFPTRGYYRLGPVTYASGDVFTLFTVERAHSYIDTLVVYPQIYPLEALGLPAKEPFGDVKVRRSLFSDPIKTQGIRDYQPQDRFRDVHWKATARRGDLQTKVYDPSTGMTMTVFLNVATFAKHWMGFDPDLLERAISVSGSIANYGMQQNWGVGMYANGSLPNSDQPIRVPASRSPEQLNKVLEALAAVTEFATGSIEQLIFRESSRLPWAATIVLVTAVVTEEMLVGLIRLKEAGRRVVLISLADDPPPQDLGNILTYHIPSNAPAFQPERESINTTEAALGTIPTPVPINANPKL